MAMSKKKVKCFLWRKSSGSIPSIVDYVFVAYSRTTSSYHWKYRFQYARFKLRYTQVSRRFYFPHCMVARASYLDAWLRASCFVVHYVAVRESGWYGSDTYEARAEVGTNRRTNENKGTGFRAIFIRNFVSIYILLQPLCLSVRFFAKRLVVCTVHNARSSFFFFFFFRHVWKTGRTSGSSVATCSPGYSASSLDC
jgi:hypothetical protein